MEQKFDELNDAKRRLKALTEFGQVISSATRVSEAKILELIYQQASRLIDTDNMYIALYDESNDAVHFGLVMVDGKRVDMAKGDEWQPHQAVEARTEEIIHTKKALFHTTKAEAEAWCTLPGHEEYAGMTLSSWLGVPMMVGGKVIGVVATYHPTQDYAYDRDDLEILQAIANQAAIALRGTEAYEALQQEQERRIAEEKFVYLGHAVDGIAHRINNTIALLPLCVSDIRRHLKTVDAVVDDELDTIERNASYLLDLADALQKPSRPSEAGRFDINLLLEDAVKAANVPSHVEVVTKLDRSLPRVQTRRLLVDVFVELITNAIAAMSESEIKRLEIGSQAYDTEFIEVWFTDTGRGVSQQEQARVFDLFYTTAKKTPERMSKGFGLWWVRTFLATQGGEITVKSEPGEGATFRVRLPLEVKERRKN